MIENIPRILFVDSSQLSVGLSELRSLTMRLLNPDTLIFVLFLLPWSVAAWAMLMMTIAALGDDRLSFDWFFGGSFLWESYNRKYLKVFLLAFAVELVFAILVLILTFRGWITL